MSEIITVANVQGYLDSKNTAWLNAEDVARGFGFTQEKNGVEYVRWETINGYLSGFGFSQRVGKGDYLPENMVYRLGFKANNEVAVRFQTILADEVLPSIRKTGGYIAAKADDTPDMIMARAILVAQDTIKKQSLRIEEQKRKIAEDAPKVLYADSTAASKTSCLVGEMAKILTQNGYEIGQNRLFKKLREEGYLGTKGEYYNVSNQRYQEMGLFEVKKSIINNPDGSTFQKSTTKITGKGQIYFVNKFLGPKTQV